MFSIGRIAAVLVAHGGIEIELQLIGIVSLERGTQAQERLVLFIRADMLSV